MKIFRTDETKFVDIARQLEDGKSRKSAGEKLVEASKDFIAGWLLKERNIDIEKLPIGETIVIQLEGKDVIRVDVKGKNRFDLARFRNEQPIMEANFTKKFPERHFDSLLPAPDRELAGAGAK